MEPGSFSPKSLAAKLIHQLTEEFYAHDMDKGKPGRYPFFGKFP